MNLFTQLILAGTIGGLTGVTVAFCAKSIYYWFIDKFIEPEWPTQKKRPK